MRRICLPLSIFLAYLTVVGIGTGTPRSSLYFRIANSTLLLIHLAFVAFMSVLVVRERWGDPRRPSLGPTMLQRVRAWITDDRTFRRYLSIRKNESATGNVTGVGALPT
jgi:hypothetical protein